LRLAQLALQAIRHIESREFFSAAKAAIGAVVLPAVARIDNYRFKSLARVFCHACGSSRAGSE